MKIRKNSDGLIKMLQNLDLFCVILKEKEHITSITYEPWHYRYVGRVHAERMKRMGLTLEEYLDLQCAKCD